MTMIKYSFPWIFILSLMAMRSAASSCTEDGAAELRAALTDVDFVLSEIERGAVEDWSFTAPLKRHGTLATDLLVKEIEKPAGKRRAAWFLLMAIRDSRPEILLFLTCTLFDKDEAMRISAAGTLGKYGAGARQCLPVLEKLAIDKEWSADEHPLAKACITQAIETIRKAIATDTTH